LVQKMQVPMAQKRLVGLPGPTILVLELTKE
jgi:hypothetical protein